MKKLIFIPVLLFSLSMFAQDYYMLVGTYDSPKSEGIYVYRFSSNTGRASLLSHVKISNPSFLAVSPDERFVFAVEEISSPDGNGGYVSAFAFNKQNGMLTLINRERSGGDHPCHVELDKTGRWLFVSNYTGGSLSVLPVALDGNLGKAYTIKHRGSSTNPQRQKSPHVHGAFIAPDNRQLLVTDLGTDKIMLYDFDAATGKLIPSATPFVNTVPGSGPRSLAFHPGDNKVYVMEELTGTISAYKYKKHELKAWKRFQTNPKGDSSFPGSAHIQFSADGKFLYASNRAEQNVINVFSCINGFHHIERISTKGKGPRHFSIDPSGQWLVCGNQLSDEIVVFGRHPGIGTLTDEGHRIRVGKPVCIKWINTK